MAGNNFHLEGGGGYAKEDQNEAVKRSMTYLDQLLNRYGINKETEEKAKMDIFALACIAFSWVIRDKPMTFASTVEQVQVNTKLHELLYFVFEVIKTSSEDIVVDYKQVQLIADRYIELDECYCAETALLPIRYLEHEQVYQDMYEDVFGDYEEVYGKEFEEIVKGLVANAENQGNEALKDVFLNFLKETSSSESSRAQSVKSGSSLDVAKEHGSLAAATTTGNQSPQRKEKTVGCSNIGCTIS